MSISDGRKMTGVMKKATQKDLLFIRDFLIDGKLKPIIDECYWLIKTAKAFRYFEKGHSRGKVVIAVVQSSWNLIGYGEFTVDWETYFGFTITFSVILTWTKSREIKEK